jgi:hypothetical protein
MPHRETRVEAKLEASVAHHATRHAVVVRHHAFDAAGLAPGEQDGQRQDREKRT